MATFDPASFLNPAGAMAEASFTSFLSTPTGRAMLQQIEDRAKAGVEAAAKHNAINLMAFALAGGAIGGVIFKGPIGILAAAGVAIWAGTRLLANPTAPPPQATVQGFGAFGTWPTGTWVRRPTVECAR